MNHVASRCQCSSEWGLLSGHRWLNEFAETNQLTSNGEWSVVQSTPLCLPNTANIQRSKHLHGGPRRRDKHAALHLEKPDNVIGGEWDCQAAVNAYSSCHWLGVAGLDRRLFSSQQGFV